MCAVCVRSDFAGREVGGWNDEVLLATRRSHLFVASVCDAVLDESNMMNAEFQHGYIWFLKYRAQIRTTDDADTVFIEDESMDESECYIPDLRPFWRDLIPYVVNKERG